MFAAMGCGVIAARTMAVAHFGQGAVVAVMSGMAIAATGVSFIGASLIGASFIVASFIVASFIAALPTPNAASSSLTTRARALRKRADRTAEPPIVPDQARQPARSAAPLRELAVFSFFLWGVRLRAGIRIAVHGSIGQLEPFGRHFAVNDTRRLIGYFFDGFQTVLGVVGVFDRLVGLRCCHVLPLGDSAIPRPNT